jgi:hypothetical protein
VLLSTAHKQFASVQYAVFPVVRYCRGNLYYYSSTRFRVTGSLPSCVTFGARQPQAVKPGYYTGILITFSLFDCAKSQKYYGSLLPVVVCGKECRQYGSLKPFCCTCSSATALQYPRFNHSDLTFASCKMKCPTIRHPPTVKYLHLHHKCTNIAQSPVVYPINHASSTFP